VFCLFSDKTVIHSVFSIIITIIVFFVIGCVARHYAVKWFPNDDEEDTQLEEQPEEQAEEEIAD
jgi:flagellar basal body-associated protein FliL